MLKKKAKYHRRRFDNCCNLSMNFSETQLCAGFCPLVCKSADSAQHPLGKSTLQITGAIEYLLTINNNESKKHVRPVLLLTPH